MMSAFHSLENHELSRTNSGGYSHQSENSAARRTVTVGNARWYSLTSSSPRRLVRA